MQGDYLFGDGLSVADCYLFVMLRWAEKFGIAVPEALLRMQWRMEARPSVQAALAQEEASCAPFADLRGLADRRVAVRENPEQHRFERPIHNDAIAAAYYRTADGRLVFIHTEVPTEFSGQGIATELARGTFELLRQSGRKAILRCPFMVHFFASTRNTQTSSTGDRRTNEPRAVSTGRDRDDGCRDFSGFALRPNEMAVERPTCPASHNAHARGRECLRDVALRESLLCSLDEFHHERERRFGMRFEQEMPAVAAGPPRLGVRFWSVA